MWRQKTELQKTELQKIECYIRPNVTKDRSDKRPNLQKVETLLIFISKIVKEYLAEILITIIILECKFQQVDTRRKIQKEERAMPTG